MHVTDSGVICVIQAVIANANVEVRDINGSAIIAKVGAHQISPDGVMTYTIQ